MPEFQGDVLLGIIIIIGRGKSVILYIGPCGNIYYRIPRIEITVHIGRIFKISRSLSVRYAPVRTLQIDIQVAQPRVGRHRQIIIVIQPRGFVPVIDMVPRRVKPHIDLIRHILHALHICAQSAVVIVRFRYIVKVRIGDIRGDIPHEGVILPVRQPA